jgi:hypothetical protein
MIPLHLTDGTIGILPPHPRKCKYKVSRKWTMLPSTSPGTAVEFLDKVSRHLTVGGTAMLSIMLLSWTGTQMLWNAGDNNSWSEE